MSLHDTIKSGSKPLSHISVLDCRALWTEPQVTECSQRRAEYQALPARESVRRAGMDINLLKTKVIPTLRNLCNLYPKQNEDLGCKIRVGWSKDGKYYM